MADSKIDFSFENLHFSCEGDNAWVEKQLNNVLSRIPALLSVHKKGDGIVEEVIEVKEEDVKEVVTKAPRAPKTAKAPRAKAASRKAKAVKVTAEPVAVATESAEPKAPKARKTTKKADKATVTEGAQVKRGRKAQKPKPAAKANKAKKKVAKAKPDAVPQVDSPLYQFLVEKKVEKNQVRKFLAVAVFLSRNNDITKLSTPMISKALKSYGIEKLQNASDCLNKNEKKGYCVKMDKEFIITENGYLSID